MYSLRRFLVFCGIAVLALLPASAVLAFPADGGLVLAVDEMEEEEEPEVSEFEGGVVPAVEADAPSDEEEEQPWTSRFLAPTVAAMAALGIVAAGAYYVVRVRGRYRVV